MPADNSHLILQHLMNLQSTDEFSKNQPQIYPVRPNRYFSLGWNANSQDCYTENDVNLLNKIKSEYEVLAGKEKAQKFFDTGTTKYLWDLWQCTTPAMKSDANYDSFTLPNRQAKDTLNYPLWIYADNMARQIANWQGDRVKGQNIKLLNDPVMLVFYMLREEFFNNIAMTECKNENIDSLSRLQSFIKNLVYWVPNYGPDRLHLHEIQNSLQEATKKIANCVANKELPQLLTDAITSGKSLETIIGTYLHFLVDQRVADNFSTEYFEGDKCNVQASPVCKLFQAATLAEEQAGSGYKLFNKFYTPVKMADGIQMQLRSSIMEAIKLPRAINKDQYLEVMAILESLINVRKTMENFRSIQGQLGNYEFALKFVDDANTLAGNYRQLIRKAEDLLSGLIKSADQGLKEILHGPHPGSKQNYFERNLRSLETCAAKDTKPDAQLKAYSKNAAESVEKYQQAMRNLVTNIRSGAASRELELAISNLSKEISQLNKVLPALINKLEISLEDDLKYPTAEVTTVENKAEYHPQALNKIFSYGAWDEVIKHDPIKNQPIYTYRLFDETNKEIGSVEFYGKPMLCMSADRKQHNAKMSGILAGLPINADTPINEICDVLPPGMFERVIFSAKSGAMYGLISGASNVVGYTLKGAGLSDKLTAALKSLTYYGGIFSLNYYSYYQQQCSYQDTCEAVNALYYAACETGKLWVMNSVAGFIGSLFAKAGSSLADNGWMGYVNKGLQYGARAGFFAWQAANNGVVETAAAAASALLTEQVIEQGTRRIIN